MASISIEKAERVYADGTRALDSVQLEIRDGEFLVLVGPSGCGKSTLLRAIAGLEPLDSGRIRLGATDVTTLSPGDRDVAMVFQSYALYPQMSVADNLEFGLKSRRMAATERRARVSETATLLGLTPLLARVPSELSGGQRQRVAMGRAIARRPQAFLMDEPLSNLDAQLRATMRTELAKLHASLCTTTVYVTHDQVEAMSLGQRVAVMRDGRILQCDTPRVIFDRPRNVFVATFMGSPAMNLLPTTIADGTLRMGKWMLPLEGSRPLPAKWPASLLVGLRPTDCAIGAAAPTAWPRIEVLPWQVEEHGHERILRCRDSRDGESPVELCALLGGRDAIAVAQPLQLAIDTAQLQFFDAVSGDALA
jgi:multiple sugar transport system ATP-binding protein